MKTGIDISQYQAPAKIDYDKLANNIDFAIIRAGFTGYGTGQDRHTDPMFEKHYKELTARGVPCGAYWYSVATSVAEGRADAEYFLNVIKGKKFAYPVYIDTEDTHRQRPAGRTLVTAAVYAFCEAVEKKGYFVGIYASESWFNHEIDYSQLTRFDMWVANWSAKSRPMAKFAGMWQYTSDGNVSGYSGRLDMNRSYKDYPVIMNNNGLNGFSKSGAQWVTNELVSAVIRGEWGNGQERKNRLASAGYDYQTVQNAVNKRLYG